MLHEGVPASSSHVTASVSASAEQVSALAALTFTLIPLSIYIPSLILTPSHFLPSRFSASPSLFAAFALLALVVVRLLNDQGTVANVHKLTVLQMHGAVDTSAKHGRRSNSEVPTLAIFDTDFTLIDVVADHVGITTSATPMKAVRVAHSFLLRDMATLSPKLAIKRVLERVHVASLLGLFLPHLFSCFCPLLLILFPSSFISFPPWDEAPPGVVPQSSSFNG